jgi:flagellar biosynthesis component FlhA
MNRSRSFNRFHRYLARQKRHGLKAVLPQSSQLRSIINGGVDRRRDDLDRLSHQDIEMELLESQS